MGKREARNELYVKAELNIIFKVIKTWLKNNQFDIKEEEQPSYIKAYKGAYVALFDKDARRWLEIHLSMVPRGNLVAIYERVWKGEIMFRKILDEEVASLSDFIKSQFPNVDEHEAGS